MSFFERILPEERGRVAAAVSAVADMKGERPVVYDVTKRQTFTDYILICHGSSDRHVEAIAEGVERQLKEKGWRAYGVEGASHGAWVLIDYGGLVIHVFHEPMRDFYDIEGLWTDCPNVDGATLAGEAEAAAKAARAAAKAAKIAKAVAKSAPRRRAASKAGR